VNTPTTILELISNFYCIAGDSGKKWAIIGGSVGGVVVLLCVFFAWRWFTKPKRVPRGTYMWKSLQCNA